MDNKTTRRTLWLGKFAFPKVNTKKTKMIYVTQPTILIPKGRGFEKIELKKWGYKSRHHQLTVIFAYDEGKDTLFVRRGPTEIQPLQI